MVILIEVCPDFVFAADEDRDYASSMDNSESERVVGYLRRWIDIPETLSGQVLHGPSGVLVFTDVFMCCSGVDVAGQPVKDSDARFRLHQSGRGT